MMLKEMDAAKRELLLLTCILNKEKRILQRFKTKEDNAVHSSSCLRGQRLIVRLHLKMPRQQADGQTDRRSDSKTESLSSRVYSVFLSIVLEDTNGVELE